MRIVHVIWSMTPGGLETMLLDISTIQGESNEVHIIVVNDQCDDVLASSLAGRYTVHRINRPSGSRNPWHLVKLRYRLASLRPDVVHIHQLSLMNILKFLRVPVVATVHDTRFALPRDAQPIKRIICISNAVQEAVKACLPDAQTVVVHNGVRSRDIRRKDGRRGAEFLIVQISRLVHEKKGQDILLQALHELNVKFPDLAFRAEFWGSGPSLEFLERMTNDLGLASCVRFCGEVARNDVYVRLAGFDLLVQPSRYEGFGLTVVEAMIAGVPVIVSDIEGPLEIIAGGRYGDSFISGDAQDLARKISEVVVASPSNLTDRCDRARATALENYEINKTCEGYTAIYKECLAALI